MNIRVKYYKCTDFGLIEGVGHKVGAKTSDGVLVSAVMQREWNGWNFTHSGCGFRIYLCDLKTEKGAIKRFEGFVSKRSSKDFAEAENKARQHPDFEQPPEPIYLKSESSTT